MKKSLIVVFVLILCLSTSAIAFAAELKVGMECDYAPFNWTQAEASDFALPIQSGGFADGYDVQIAKIIADGLGRELVIVKTGWDGLIPAVQTSAIDAIIAGMSPTAERSMTIDFSEPYYSSDLVIVVKKDAPFADAKALADFKDARITAQLNTFHYSVIDQIEGVQKQIAMETFPAMIVALRAGAIDGYVAERPGAESDCASNPDLSFVAFPEGEGFECSPEDVAISVGLMKDSPLKEQIDEILAGIDAETRVQMMIDAGDRRPQ